MRPDPSLLRKIPLLPSTIFGGITITRDNGLPTIIRTNNGPEFFAEAFKQWRTTNDEVLQHIQPGKPTQNVFIARVNRTSRKEMFD